MTRAMLLATAVVSTVAAAPPARTQVQSPTRQTSPSLVAPGKDPYAGIFRYGAQPVPPRTASRLHDTPTMLCGTAVFRGDPKIDAGIVAIPKLDGRGSRPTPKARIIEPKVCVEN